MINPFLINKTNDKSLYSPSQKSILMLSDSCQNKCKPYIAYIPARTIGNLTSKKALRYKIELETISEKMKIPFLDGENIIDRNNEYNYAPKGGHLSMEGYAKFANFIIESISE